MKATFLKELPVKRSTMESFGGYDHRERTSEGSFFDDCNLSARDYPVMSVRRKRARLCDVPGLQGALIKDKIAYCAEGKLFYDGKEVEGVFLSEGEKQLVSMGAKLIVFPDMIEYNTISGEAVRIYSEMKDGDVPCHWYMADWQALGITEARRYTVLPDGEPYHKYDDEYFYLYDEDGNPIYEKEWIVDTDENGDPLLDEDGNEIYIEVETDVHASEWVFTPVEGMYAYEMREMSYEYENADGETATGGREIAVFYQYREGRFVPVETDRVMFYMDVGEKPVIGNTVRVYRGMEEELEAEVVEVLLEREYHGQYKYGLPDRKGKGQSLSFVNDPVYIRLKMPTVYDTETLVSGVYSPEYPQRPIMDGIMENGNRLWGWRHGYNLSGDFVNEIYSTELGTAGNWATFEGIASDSYGVTLGSDGDFTGAIYFSGSLYFFKENCYHRIMGFKPSQYQVVMVNCFGVEKGSERSLVAAGDAIYYKGVDGIYCYDGAVPYRISDELGAIRYKNAVAGTMGERIFFEMEDSAGEKKVFVYDTLKKLWHVETPFSATAFLPAHGNLVAVLGDGLALVDGENVDEAFTQAYPDIAMEQDFEWFGEFSDFGLSDPDAKYVSKLVLRMTVDEGARVAVRIMCDSDGSWRTAAVVSAKNKKSWCLPVVTPRCDHFRIRLEGRGGFRLWTLTREMESTNEVRR